MSNLAELQSELLSVISGKPGESTPDWVNRTRRIHNLTVQIIALRPALPFDGERELALDELELAGSQSRP